MASIFRIRNAEGQFQSIAALQGPKGDTGPQGPQGEKGETGGVSVQQLLEQVYPIGAIYMSVNDANPSSFIGGTWEQLTNRFLVGAGDGYEAGNTGGTSSTTLSTDNLPGHTHSFSATSGNQSANHTHSVGAHAHGLNSHVHSVGAHSHGLNSHKHTFTTGNQSANHTHSGTTSSNGSHGHSMWGSQSFASGTTNGWRAVRSGDSTNCDYNSWTSVDSNGAHTHTMTTGSNSANHTHSGTTAAASGSTANSSAFNSGAASGSTANSSAFNTGNNSANHTHDISGTTGSTGSATSFTNLPPYLAVYMWKRIA